MGDKITNFTRPIVWFPSRTSRNCTRNETQKKIEFIQKQQIELNQYLIDRIVQEGTERRKETAEMRKQSEAVLKRAAEVLKDCEETIKESSEILKQSAERRKENAEGSKECSEIRKECDEMIHQSPEITEHSDEIINQSPAVTKQCDKVIKECDGMIKQFDEVIKQSAEMIKQSHDEIRRRQQEVKGKKIEYLAEEKLTGSRASTSLLRIQGSSPDIFSEKKSSLEKDNKIYNSSSRSEKKDKRNFFLKFLSNLKKLLIKLIGWW